MGDLNPVQCEITYINHIDPTKERGHHSQLGKVLALGFYGYDEDLLPDLENIRIATQHIIRNNTGFPFARLHISTQPAFSDDDNQPLFIMSMTARGRPFKKSIDGVLDFIDQGREQIVLSFKSVTTPAMHKSWGLKE